jgi:hypothetical protein
VFVIIPVRKNAIEGNWTLRCPSVLLSVLQQIGFMNIGMNWRKKFGVRSLEFGVMKMESGPKPK